MRLFTEHRVIGHIVLPGTSHVGFVAASLLVMLGSQTHTAAIAGMNASMKGVLLARPFVVMAAAPSETASSPDIMKPAQVPTTYVTLNAVFSPPTTDDPCAQNCQRFPRFACMVDGLTHEMYNMIRMSGGYHGPRFRTVNCSLCSQDHSHCVLQLSSACESW